MVINEYQQYAARLAYNLWRDLDYEFKLRYRHKIWDLFAANLRVAAMQSSDLSTLVEKMSLMMPIGTGRNKKIRVERVGLVEGVDNRQLMYALRKATNYVVLLARKMNDEQKDYDDEGESDNE